MPPQTQAWQVFHSRLYILFLYMGGRAQAPSLVQGLRPRNAPLQNHLSPTVCILRNVSAGEHGLYTSYVTKSLNGSRDDWLVKSGTAYGFVVTDTQQSTAKKRDWIPFRPEW